LDGEFPDPEMMMFAWPDVKTVSAEADEGIVVVSGFVMNANLHEG
jgi:hypothetical protein